MDCKGEARDLSSLFFQRLGIAYLTFLDLSDKAILGRLVITASSSLVRRYACVQRVEIIIFPKGDDRASSEAFLL